MPARTPGRSRAARLAALPAVAAVGLAGLAISPPATALSNLTTANGANVYVNDARRPGLDTGSIRNVTGSKLEAFGSLFVHVDAPAGREPRMNDQMMRGFGLTAAAPGSYRSTKSVRLGDVLMTRKVQVATATNTTSFFDTFTNASTAPVTLKVSFGGSLGSGLTATTSPNRATITDSSNGDAVVQASDTWITATTPGATRPTGVVVGSSVASLADQQSNPFETPYVATGSRANDLGFVRELTIDPGETQSLMQYVVVGATSDTTQIATDTEALATTPDFSNLTIDELCTLQNWSLTQPQVAACAGAEPLQLPEADPEVAHTTDVAYDVTGKTIAQLQADMTAGTVTSVEITKAYLDRIEAYDGGGLGFHSFITVAKDAVAQALAADKARAAGTKSDLLGVPIALKDLYDTKDMPTSGGTLALKDWEPKRDAWQVEKLREAGAVIIGKTNLSEFANSGSFSESGFMQTWNALYPSKSSFGSSGGSATAVGADLAAAAMGTQTGVSLYAPSTGASLSTFRGTDGLTSTNGVMPLTWATDYAGPMTKSVTDLAIMLDATATQATGNNPEDLLTSRVDNANRPVEWKSSLRTTALQGKVIGYVPTAFASTAIIDDTAGAVALAQAEAAVEAAGGTLVALPAGAATSPSTSVGSFPTTGSAGAEGWERYIAETRPATFPLTTKQLMESQANLPYNVSGNYGSQPMDDTSVTNLLARRDALKVSADTWMDTAFGQPVDAVIYPGFLTSVGNNDASSAIMSSDRASGVITQSIGLPTAILPIGKNDEGQSNSVQVVGRAWDDAAVLGYGYALEQQTKAAMHTAFAPALPWSGPAASATALTLASTATTYGATTTATVSVAADPAATGAVSVQVAGSTVTGTLVGGTATVTLPATVPVGTHLVTATYGGSAKVAGSAATATLKVAQAAPKVAVKLAKASVRKGQKAKLKVTVGAPATVLVYDGGEVVRTVKVSRTKTVTLPKLGAGKHKLRAYVVGSDSFLAAWSRTVKLTVKK